jgi:hypothetical protein
MCLFL